MLLFSQLICLTSLLTVVCRRHPPLRIIGRAGQLQVCLHNLITSQTCTFINSYNCITKTMTSFLRHQGVAAYVCLCPLGSVTGICPCRVKCAGPGWLLPPGASLFSKRPRFPHRRNSLNEIHVQLTINALSRKAFF